MDLLHTPTIPSVLPGRVLVPLAANCQWQFQECLGGLRERARTLYELPRQNPCLALPIRSHWVILPSPFPASPRACAGRPLPTPRTGHSWASPARPADDPLTPHPLC